MGKHVSPHQVNVSPEDRISRIHAGIQKALEDLAATESRTVTGVNFKGEKTTMTVPATFGLRRVPTVTVLHNGVLRDSGVPAFQPSPNYRLDYFAVSRTGKPLQVGRMRLQDDFKPAYIDINHGLEKEILEFADRSLAVLKKKDVYSGTVGDMKTTARPLRLTKAECLKCHSGSKIGDPLAIMVYQINTKMR